MRKIRNRIAVLFGIFLLSVIVFFLLTGEEGTLSETQEMSEATFPVLFFTCGGEDVNESFGYVQQMDVSSIRDTITPVMEDLAISVVIDAYDNEISSLSYNIYDPDSGEVIETHSAVSVEVTDAGAAETLLLYDALGSGEEAVLEVILNVNDDEQIYYYTRLTMQEDIPLTLGMSFVKTFHEETLSGSDGSSLSAYLETDSGTEYTSLEHVTIESALSLIMWGSIEPVLASEVSLDIAEVNESYQAFTMTYLVSSALTGATYYVEEYFRVRIINSQAYLLDYDRTAEQIFAAVENAVSEEMLQLGIRDEDVSFVSDEDGSLIAFVQAGELWEYNASGGQLVRVYGYLDTDETGSADTDFRDLNMEHEFRICSMDDSGNMYFLLCGYQNRGAHEGENGVSLFYYDAINQTVEEKIFFSSTCAYQVLKEEIGELAYVNADGALCMMYGGTLYEISSDTAQVQVLASDIDPDYCMVSDSGRYAAFLYEGEADSASSLKVVDLDSGKITGISGDGGYVRPLGYLKENLIYGIAQIDDVITDAAGNVIFAMNTLVILDADLEPEKEYDEGSYYVTEALIDGGTVYLSRVEKTDDGYEETSEDTIIDYDSLDDVSAAVSSSDIDETEETQVVIVMTVSAADSIDLCIPQATVTDSLEETTLLASAGAVYPWRVYLKQDVICAADSLSEAITLADETAAVVTDASGNPLWRRNNDSSGSISDLEAQTDFTDSQRASVAAALHADGVSDDLIAEALSDTSDPEEAVAAVLTDALFLDLTGCSLEEVLYFTAQGRPVLTVFSGSMYIIQSYSPSSVTVYNPYTDASSTYSVTEMESVLETAGNVFYTWLL